MIAFQGHLTLWRVLLVRYALVKNFITEINFQMNKINEQYSSDDIFSQGYLIELSVPCNIGSFELN